MWPMKLARSTKSLVALVTAIVLLLCQAASSAQACAHAITAKNTAVEVASCQEGHAAEHYAGSDAPVSQSQSACDNPKVYSDSFKVPVLSISDLPALQVVYLEPAGPALTSVATQVAQAVCYSPPLTLLHCRLLN